MKFIALLLTTLIVAPAAYAKSPVAQVDVTTDVDVELRGNSAEHQ